MFLKTISFQAYQQILFAIADVEEFKLLNFISLLFMMIKLKKIHQINKPRQSYN